MTKREMVYAVTNHGNYFHFITECLLPLSELRPDPASRIVFRGRYQELVQLFSDHPLLEEPPVGTPVVKVTRQKDFYADRASCTRLELLVTQAWSRWECPALLPRPQLLLIQRTGTRKLYNLDELHAALTALGLPTRTAVLEETSCRQQAELFYTADLVIGVHGAGLINVIYMRPGTAVLELLPRGNRPGHYRALALTRHLHYRSLEAATPSQWGVQHGSWCAEFIARASWPSQRELASLLAERTPEERMCLMRTLRDVDGFHTDTARVLKFTKNLLHLNKCPTNQFGFLPASS